MAAASIDYLVLKGAGGTAEGKAAAVSVKWIVPVSAGACLVVAAAVVMILWRRKKRGKKK